MAVKKRDNGKVIAQVGGLRVRQIREMGTDENRNPKTVGTKIAIFKGKKVVEDGFKNKESAVTRAKELV